MAKPLADPRPIAVERLAGCMTDGPVSAEHRALARAQLMAQAPRGPLASARAPRRAAAATLRHPRPAVDAASWTGGATVHDAGELGRAAEPEMRRARQPLRLRERVLPLGGRAGAALAADPRRGRAPAAAPRRVAEL